MRARGQRGFTLIEIMISIAVLALLIMVGIPSFTTFIQNSRIRVAADALLNGMQTARNEAIRRNECVQLKISSQTAWAVSTCRDPDTALQSRTQLEGTDNVGSVLAPDGADTVSFNGLGRIVNPNPGDGSVPLTQVDVANAALGTDGRPLRIIIPTGGGVRMCDPSTKLLSTDPRACPP
jgi:type IV fimbrial biogenesis protein FimT